MQAFSRKNRGRKWKWWKQKVSWETYITKRTDKTLEEDIAVLKKINQFSQLKKEELTRSLQYYKNLDEQLKKVQVENNEFVQILIKNGIPQADVFSYKIDTTKYQH